MAGAGAKLFTSGSVLTADQVNTFLMDQSIMRFTSTTTRDAAFGGAGEPTLAEGMFAYTTDTNTLWLYNGSSWVNLLGSDIGEQALSNRNVVINGAMQVAQRATSVAGITTTGYYTADRFGAALSSLGTWTQSVEADAPAGSGLRNSWKMLCTTADASPAAGDLLTVYQIFEGQNTNQFQKGTASAKPYALSFWVKSNVTGTYIAELFDNTNNRQVSASYTISASATWEKKTISFPADTTGAFANNSAAGLTLQWFLGCGTSYTSGTLNTASWAATTTANRAVGQTNLAAATSNYWQITGVQLEVGTVSTPFEFETFGDTLAKCQRYYEKTYDLPTAVGAVTQVGMVGIEISTDANTNNYLIRRTQLQIKKRVTPVITSYDAAGTSGKCVKFNTGAAGTDGATLTIDSIGESSFRSYIFNENSAGYVFHYVASAEL